MNIRKLSNPDLLIPVLLFTILWVYLIIRAAIVPPVSDEVVTKWSYMISWNPWPYHGYIDANNHFLNSLLGGLFIRLFNSDNLLIVRLPNLLAFPLYFWSAFSFRIYITRKINFYLLLILLTFSTFIIEFFGIARGYGISMALLLSPVA